MEQEDRASKVRGIRNYESLQLEAISNLPGIRPLCPLSQQFDTHVIAYLNVLVKGRRQRANTLCRLLVRHTRRKHVLVN